MVEKNTRTFHFTKPAVEIHNRNLVFVLHGSGGTGNDIRKAADELEKLSGSEKLFAVYPDGYKKYWNECRKAANSAANMENINEQAFFDSMITYFSTRYKTNSDKVFVIGLSGGGHMAYKLAITLPEKIGGICVVAANQPDSTNLDCFESRNPVPVMIINGTSDDTNPYEGGEMKVNGSSFGKVLSSENSFHYWASLAGYSGKPIEQKLPDPYPGNGQTIVQYSYKQPGKAEVVLLKVEGGKHEFPKDVNAFSEAWKFFKRQ